MSMTQAGDRMNRPIPPDPPEWAECEWDDCFTMVHEDMEGQPLCWQHYMESIEEHEAELAIKRAKGE